MTSIRKQHVAARLANGNRPPAHSRASGHLVVFFGILTLLFKRSLFQSGPTCCFEGGQLASWGFWAKASDVMLRSLCIQSLHSMANLAQIPRYLVRVRTCKDRGGTRLDPPVPRGPDRRNTAPDKSESAAERYITSVSEWLWDCFFFFFFFFGK